MGCQQNIYIPKELWQQFGDYAKTQKVSRSFLVRQIICSYLRTEDPARYQEMDGEHTHQKITDRAVEKILRKARGD